MRILIASVLLFAVSLGAQQKKAPHTVTKTDSAVVGKDNKAVYYFHQFFAPYDPKPKCVLDGGAVVHVNRDKAIFSGTPGQTIHFSCSVHRS
jgi:hypothetical protein